MHYNTYVWGPSMPYTCKWHALSPYAPVHMCMSKIVTGPRPGPPVMDNTSQYNSLSLSLCLSLARFLSLYIRHIHICMQGMLSLSRSLSCSLARALSLTQHMAYTHIHAGHAGTRRPRGGFQRMHDLRGRPRCVYFCSRGGGAPPLPPLPPPQDA